MPTLTASPLPPARRVYRAVGAGLRQVLWTATLGAIVAELILGVPRAAAGPSAPIDVDRNAPNGNASGPLIATDSNTGDATYVHAIALPPGRDGMTPRLALSYNSSGGNSDVGRGWTLGGPIAIERDTRTTAPALAATDRFVLRAGAAVQTLVKIGTLAGFAATGTAYEYRLADDSDDRQFIFLEASNQWRVRTRDGNDAFYQAGIVHSPGVAPSWLPGTVAPIGVAAQTQAWLLTRQRDANGNTIDYRYEAPTRFGNDVNASGPIQGRHAETPRLVEIQYGGNDGSQAPAAALPHLFRVVLARHGLPTPSALASYAPPARDPSCYPSTSGVVGARYEPVSLRAGGAIADSGEGVAVWGIGVEAVAPGTTDGTRREFATRLASVTRLTYNVDELGCANADELHPTLKQIETFGIAEDGTVTAAPPVSFSYYGWQRKFTPIDAVMPAAHDYVSSALDIWLWRGLGATVTSSADGQRALGLGGEARGASNPFLKTAAATEQLFRDVDGDAVPDFVDYARSSQCYPTEASAGASWIKGRLGGWSDPAAPLGLGPVTGVDRVPVCGPTDYESPVIHCTLDYEFRAGFPYSFARRLFLDLDSDGYEDLVEVVDDFDAAHPLWFPYAAWPTGAHWTWRRNTLPDTRVVGFGPAQTLPRFPWQLPTSLVGGAAIAPLGYYGTAAMDARPFNYMPDDDGCHGAGNPEISANHGWNVDGPMQRLVNDGARVLAANYSENAERMTSQSVFEDTVAYAQSTSDTRAGALLDLTGDGVVDRVVSTSFSDQRYADGDPRRIATGAMVLYRGTGPGTFGPPELWSLPGGPAGASADPRTRDARYPRVTHRAMTLSALRGLLSARRKFTTDAVADVNGDGLPDFLSNLPNIDGGTQAIATTLESLGVSLNHRLGIAGWGGGSSGSRLPQAVALEDTDAIASAAQSRRARVRYQMFDHNGDGLPDFVGETFIQYGLGAGFTAPLRFVAAEHGLADPFRPELTFTERSWHEGASQVVRPERVIMDVTGDARPELVIHDDYTGDAMVRIYTDVDPGAAPGRLRTISNGLGASTEVRYQTQVAAAQPGDAAVPVKRWVVASTRTTIGSTALTTRFAYGQPVLAKTSELVDGAPVTPGAGFRGFQRIAVCHPDGTQTETRYDFSGRLEGRPSRQVRFGTVNDGKCVFIDDETPGGRIRERKSYEYETSTLPAASGRESVSQIRPRRTVTETFLPGQALSIKREDLTTWSQVSGRWVATSTLARSIPEQPSETITTRTSYAANPRTATASYRVVVTERAASGARFGDVGKTRFFYDGSTTYGAFTRGNPTATQVFTAAASSATTTRTLDVHGHVLTEQSPLGLVERTCWDDKRLYPVARQDAAGLVTRAVYAYATGAELEASGPISYPATALTCGAASGTGSFASRRPAVLPVWKFTRALQPSTTTSHPDVPLLPADAATGTSGTQKRYWASHSAGWVPMERVATGLVPTIPRPFVGLAIGGATLATGTLAVSAPTDWFTASPPTTTAPTWRNRYDGLGRLIASYGPRGRNLDGSFAIGQLALTEFDPLGTRVTSWTGRADATTIDKLRAPMREVQLDAAGRPSYDARIVGRTASAPWGRYVATSFGYDEVARPWSSCGPTPDDAGGCQTVVRRDNLGVVLEARDVAGATSAVAYAFVATTAGVRMQVTRTNPSGDRVIERLDSLGRVVERDATPVPGVVLTWKSEFDAAGRARIATDPLGVVIVNDYDLAGQATSVRRYASRADLDLARPPLRATTSSYDLDGKLTAAVETAIGEAARTTTVSYDPKGRVTTVTPPAAPGLPNHGATGYVYDDIVTSNGYGRVKRMTSPTEDVDYTYDGRGLVAAQKRSYHIGFAGRTLSDAIEVGFTYDLSGAPTGVTVYPTPGGAGEAFTFQYDADGTLTAIRDEARARTMVSYSWNDAGALRRAIDFLGGKEEFFYGAAGPMRSHVVELGTARWEEVTERDASGRPTLVTTTDRAFSGLGSSMLGFGYDGMGRITSTAGSYTTGATVASYFESLAYDRTRLDASYTTLPGAADRDVVYRYLGADPAQLGKLMARDGSQIYGAAYSGFGAMKSRQGESFVLDPSDRVREDAGALYAYGATGERTHSYAKATGKVTATLGGFWELGYSANGTGFVRTDSTVQLGSARVTTGSGATTFLHRDYQGSMALARGAVGGSASRQAYSPYGAAIYASAASPTTIGYQGGTMSTTGSALVRFGARDYDPTTKQWTAQDPVVGNPAYGFNLDNPAAFVDPSGRDPQWACNNCVGPGGFVDMLFRESNQRTDAERTGGPGLGESLGNIARLADSERQTTAILWAQARSEVDALRAMGRLPEMSFNRYYALQDTLLYRFFSRPLSDRLQWVVRLEQTARRLPAGTRTVAERGIYYGLWTPVSGIFAFTAGLRGHRIMEVWGAAANRAVDGWILRNVERSAHAIGTAAAPVMRGLGFALGGAGALLDIRAGIANYQAGNYEWVMNAAGVGSLALQTPTARLAAAGFFTSYAITSAVMPSSVPNALGDGLYEVTR